LNLFLDLEGKKGLTTKKGEEDLKREKLKSLRGGPSRFQVVKNNYSPKKKVTSLKGAPALLLPECPDIAISGSYFCQFPACLGHLLYYRVKAES
jgi:hypothetical protein